LGKTADTYLRINATCQQFDELYETYDIQEGDLMYLAREERIAIWYNAACEIHGSEESR